ncbi:hypothetical protein Tco_0765698 [Tanacetum coccineum]
MGAKLENVRADEDFKLGHLDEMWYKTETADHLQKDKQPAINTSTDNADIYGRGFQSHDTHRGTNRRHISHAQAIRQPGTSNWLFEFTYQYSRFVCRRSPIVVAGYGCAAMLITAMMIFRECGCSYGCQRCLMVILITTGCDEFEKIRLKPPCWKPKVNFWRFEKLYGDRALADALGIALKMTLSVPLADILAYRKKDCTKAQAAMSGHGRVPLCVVEIFGSLCRDYVVRCVEIICALCGDYLCAYHHMSRVCPNVNAPAGRLLGVYDLAVVTPRELVYTGDKTRGDARSWYMINRDAKS